ncbi:MAG: phosphodiester glycosidase family protein [Terracoccus sp.]
MSIDQRPPAVAGTDAPTSSSGPPPPGRPRRQRRRRHRKLKIAALVVLALPLAPTVSFVQAMTYPGNAPASVRAVEWVRDHGGGGLVDRVETWYYSRNAPAAVGPPSDRLPPSSGQPMLKALAKSNRLPSPPPRPAMLSPALSGEGVWTVPRTSSRGLPALYTTWFRPDPSHTTITVAAAVIPQHVDAIALGGGTREPVPGSIAVSKAQVPPAARPSLVAVFNAGFKMADSGGGWYAGGQEVVPLRPGLASLVIDRSGRATVGAWNQGVSMGPQVAAVRQNLHLIVTDGHPVAGLADNNQGLYGTGKNQFQYTWRSGIGTNARGDLVYVAGRGLNLSTLAIAMAKAGAVTGMELDMHSNMVAFNYFDTPNAVSDDAGRNLLTSMQAPPDRYLVPDQRDFFYLTTRTTP